MSRTDGQPATGVELGLPVTGDGRNYDQTVGLNVAGTYVIHIACGSGDLQSPSVTVTPPPADCGDAAFIGVRGSGDNNNGDAYPGRHAIEIARTLRETWNIALYDYDGGNDGLGGLRYPAINVANPFNLPGYGGSVDEGVQSLLSKIDDVRTHCGPSHPIVLAGFSMSFSPHWTTSMTPPVVPTNAGNQSQAWRCLLHRVSILTIGVREARSQ